MGPGQLTLDCLPKSKSPASIAAVKANSWIDYTATFIGYIGLATPNFLLALILYHKGAQWFGLPVGGLMGKDFVDQPMSWEKLKDILSPTVIDSLSR